MQTIRNCSLSLLLVALLNGCSDNASTAADTGADTSSDSAQSDAILPAPDGSADSQTSDTTAPQPLCTQNCFYVRAGATGSGDGSDWVNALTDLPASLARDATYILAAGSYAGRTFDDAASGSDVIRIVKATQASHGSETGWQSAYAQKASFGPLSLETDNYVFDGGADRGIEIVGAFKGTVLRVTGDNVTVSNVDINGNFQRGGDNKHSDGACTGLSVTSTDGVTISNALIHDVADDGVAISGSTNVDFSGNTVHALHACGTDGGCGDCFNGHSDGIELYNVKNSQFVGNFVYDVRSTATLFFGNWADELGGGPSEYCENILLANNIFYAPEVGLVAYFEDVVGLHVYHNTIWGTKDGSYGGLAIGPNTSDLHMYNNIILSINLNHLSTTFDANKFHAGDNLFGASTGQWQEAASSSVANPMFVGIPGATGAPEPNPTPMMFDLQTGSPAIDAADAPMPSNVPLTDFFGRSRANNADNGAVERQP